MRTEVYLNDKEHEWVKRQEAGAIRWIIQKMMEKYPDRLPKKEKSC